MRSGSQPGPGRPGLPSARRGARRTARSVRRNRLLALAILAILGLVVLAPAGFASDGEPTPETEASPKAQREAKRQARAQLVAEQHARKRQRAVERQSRRAAREAEHARRHAEQPAKGLGHKIDSNAEVEINCTSITVHYHGFPVVPGSPNVVNQFVVIHKQSPPAFRIVFPGKTFTFEGSEATSVIPVAAPVGPSTVDIRSNWNTNGLRGGFDIHEAVRCEPFGGFAIEKLQSLGGPFTTETLTGAVGQTILYEMVVTNTGNTPLTFSKFTDAVCDPGTIAGIPSTPVEPMGVFTIVCAHKITAADSTSKSVVNVAVITGTPEEGEGEPIKHESNEVVVAPITEEEGGGEEPKKEEPKTPPTTPGTTPTPKSGVLGTSGSSSTSSSKSGVLGFASATVPSLRGPQGCVRSTFTASVKSAGVSSVIFYLDGRRLKRLTSGNARKGLLSIKIDISKSKVGPHRVKASITMKPATSGGKATKASRALTVVHCHSAVITPHFTG